MTKMVSLRVNVPADDGVKVERVQTELRKALRAIGTIDVGEPATDDALLPLDIGASIFFLAADVLQGSLPTRKRGEKG